MARSGTHCVVSDVVTHTTDEGLEVTITTQRLAQNMFITTDPKPEDVPEDIREALLNWLQFNA